MKMFYNTKKMLRWLKPVLAGALLLFAVNSYADVIVWTGAIDSDASNPANWNPSTAIDNNLLQMDSSDTYQNSPVLDMSADYTIDKFSLAADATFTITDAGATGSTLEIDDTENSSSFHTGELIIDGAYVSYHRNVYLEDSACVIRIKNGGEIYTRSYFLVGQRYATIGGYVEISGKSTLHTKNAPDRFVSATDSGSRENVINLTDSSKIVVNGDWMAGAQFAIDSRWILSDDDNDPYAYYDAANSQTIITIRSTDELYLTETATVQIYEEDAIDTIGILKNRASQTLTSKEWKYATTSGGPYSSFSTPQTDSIFSGSLFATAGTYYVIVEATDGTTTKISQEVVVSVSSRMVSLEPVTTQTLRAGQTGGVITASVQQTAESLEWKFANTTGGPYVSFETPATANEYTPQFDSTNIYYVVCEAVVNGTSYTSPEAIIKVVELTYASQNITWTGLYGTDANDCRNYDPMMLPYSNSIIIPTGLTSTPILSTADSYSIGFTFEDSAEFIVNIPESDTLFIGNPDSYQAGKLIIESGIVVNKKTFMRLNTNNSGVIVKGNSQYLHTTSGGFIIGEKNGANGGILTIQDNGYVYVAYDETWSQSFWRFATDTAHSVITIKDNGILEIGGDDRTHVATWIATNQLRTEEGFSIKYSYNSATNITRIVSRSKTSFNLASTDMIYVATGVAGSEITTINNDAITSQEWKYSKISGGEYMSFDPAITSANFAPMFADTGLYYVVCEGSDGTETIVTDEVAITAVSVEVTPAADQQIEAGTAFATLSYISSIPAERLEWKISTTSGSGYASLPVIQKGETCSAMMMMDGVYYMVIECFFGETSIISNEVKIVVGTSAIDENKATSFKVYPNPAEGTFYIDAKDQESFAVKVYELNGKCIFTQNYSNIDKQCEISIEKSGLYFVETTQNGKTQTSKLIIK